MRAATALAAVILAAGCSPPASAPESEASRVRSLLARMQETTTGGNHGSYHRANNDFQAELWTRLKELPPGPESAALLLEAAETVYTRYDENYYTGVLWHWPYLSSPRAIELCDRILASTKDVETRERALWIKAFALRCPATEPWERAEKDFETYAEQVRWKTDYEAARELYKTIAKEFPNTPRGKASAKLAAQPDISFMLPRGPKEPDPRNPDLMTEDR
jgi:hypothetical protein